MQPDRCLECGELSAWTLNIFPPPVQVFYLRRSSVYVYRLYSRSHVSRADVYDNINETRFSMMINESGLVQAVLVIFNCSIKYKIELLS